VPGREIVRVAAIAAATVGVAAVVLVAGVVDADAADVPAVAGAVVMAVTVVAAEVGTKPFATDFHGFHGSRTHELRSPGRSRLGLLAVLAGRTNASVPTWHSGCKKFAAPSSCLE
jgi:hypothetical protein